MFVASFRQAYPQFAEMGEGGVPAQQDAEECWTQVLKALNENLPPVSNGNNANNSNNSSFIKQYFQGRYKTTTKNTETDDEPEKISHGEFLIQKCHINNEVNHLGIYICVYVCMYMYIYICMCIYIGVCVFIYA